MITVACVLRSGGDYTPAHVQRLKRNVEAFTHIPIKFVCLSDVDVPDVETIRLQHNWPGWWSKWELYRLHGPTLFFDLDTLIVDDLFPLYVQVQQRDFIMLQDFYFPDRRASGLMGWSNSVFALYRAFTEHYDVLQLKFGSNRPWEQSYVDEFYHSEYHQTPDEWQRLVTGIVSYKADVIKRQMPVESCRVICFHGKPRPWLAGGAVQKLWESYSK